MRHKVKTIVKTCDACPSQWSGKTVDGKAIYIRYRWGGFRAEIDNEVVMAAEADQEPFGGSMSDERMIEMAAEILDFSEAQWVESYEAL